MTANLSYRLACAEDVPMIVAMLADDMLGSAREGQFDQDRNQYLQAFAAISADPNNELWMALQGADIVGSFQLTFIPGLSRRGALRMQIEAVRVAASARP